MSSLQQEFRVLDRHRFKGNKRRKVYVFTVCFFISSAIWLIIKLSSLYDTEIKYPVSYINLPEKKVIVNKVDSFVVVHVKTTGLKLLEYKYLRKAPPLKIDLTRLYKKGSTPENQEYFLLTSLLHYQLQQQIGVKNQVVSVKPDSIFFKFENAFTKKVPVKLNLDISFKKQFALYDSIKIIPDSLMLTGQLKTLNSIRCIETEKVSISNVSSNTELMMKLKNPYPVNLVSFPDKQVKVILNVEKFTEDIIELPLNLVNDHENAKVKILPDKVRITFLVAMKDYKKISKDEFTIVADFSERTASSIPIHVLRYPSKVRITKIDPDKTEYLLIK